MMERNRREKSVARLGDAPHCGRLYCDFDFSRGQGSFKLRWFYQLEDA